MEKKVFSVKDGTLDVQDSGLVILIENHDDGFWTPIACNNEKYSKDYDCYLLQSTLIRKQKSDEELADEYADDMFITTHNKFIGSQSFLSGRKSFGAKELHLTRKDLEKLVDKVIDYYDRSGFYREYLKVQIASFIPPIYPHTIEVMHDGNNYLWETLNPIY